MSAQGPGAIRALLCAVAVALTMLMMPAGASAQSDGLGGSYITPFPDNDVYRMQVVGDSLAEGLLGGLVEPFANEAGLQLQRRHRAYAGLARAEFDDDVRVLSEALQREVNHITVVLVGTYDRVPIRLPGGRRWLIGSEDWRTELGRRIDVLMKVLKRTAGAVYWVGLPVLRRPDWNEDIGVMNEIMRERAYLNGLRYIDAYAGLADETGAFSAYGPDLTGKTRLLREADGIHLTPAGNRKLAHFVEREIKRDLAAAKNERSIPLAGAESEQRRVNPQRAAEPAAATKAGPAGATAKAAVSAPGGQGPSRVAALAAQGSEQRADNGRISLRVAGAGGREETIAIDLPRPAIPASVVALVARTQSRDRAAQIGETVPTSLPGGILMLNSVTPATDGGATGRARLAPTQTAFFRVLVKGERPTPKPGRVDDFRWPKVDDIAVPEPPRSAAAPTVTRPGLRASPPRPPRS